MIDNEDNFFGASKNRLGMGQCQRKIKVSVPIHGSYFGNKYIYLSIASGKETGYIRIVCGDKVSSTSTDRPTIGVADKGRINLYLIVELLRKERILLAQRLDIGDGHVSEIAATKPVRDGLAKLHGLTLNRGDGNIVTGFDDLCCLIHSTELTQIFFLITFVH